MPPAATTVYAKTPAGQHEIQTRGLGLLPLARRLLVLVDGKRTAEELAAFVAGHDVHGLLAILVEHDCITAVAGSEPAPAAASAAPAASSAVMSMAASALATLPPPERRTAEQVDMARHFMINTLNRLLEQNSRLTLTKAIFDSRGAAELRTHLEGWESAISTSWMGRKRLPELRQKLFEVL